MARKYLPLDAEANIQVSLFPGRLYATDLNTELSIDTRNIKNEILQQPSRYAIWSTMADLAKQGVEKSTEDFFNLKPEDKRLPSMEQKLTKARSQYDFLFQTSQAFMHRKVALLRLWQGTDQTDEVLQDYYNNLSNLRALLGQCTV
jgi:hypothetical protein